MMIQLELSTETQKTIVDLQSMGTNVAQAVSDGLLKGSQLAAAHVVENFLSGQALKRRTGRLAGAVEGRLLKPFEAVIGVHKRSDALVQKYKWLLGEEEMTITPKKSKFLAIPIGKGLTKAGVARYKSPRDVPEGFFVKSKAGKLLFGIKRGKRGKFRPLFVLVKSVFVQGTGALADGVLESQDKMTEAIQTEVDKAIGD